MLNDEEGEDDKMDGDNNDEDEKSAIWESGWACSQL